MAKKDKTLVCFVLDQSGSMWSVKDDTIGGYNEYIGGLRDEKNMSMMLTRFNTQAVTVGEPEPIKNVTKLSKENYRPSSGTPLYDAVGRAIKVAEAHKKVKNVLVVIMTDGLENSSIEYGRKALFALVKEKEEEGWKFAYLGANQDAYAESGLIGIQKGATMNYSQDRTAETFNATLHATKRYAQAPQSKDDLFDKEEKDKVK